MFFDAVVLYEVIRECLCPLLLFAKEDKPSMYETLDDLFHRAITLKQTPPLDVVSVDHKIWCLSNRRLSVLQMFQVTQRDSTVWVKCVLRPCNKE